MRSNLIITVILLVLAIARGCTVDNAAASVGRQQTAAPWIAELVASRIGCLGDDTLAALFPEGAPLRFAIRGGSNDILTRVAHALNAIDTEMFLFGAGPIDATCAHPLRTMYALQTCRVANNSNSKHAATDDVVLAKRRAAMLSLCEESEAQWGVRLLRCVHAGHSGSSRLTASSSALSDEARGALSRNTREVSKQALLCRLAATCTLDRLPALCTVVVAAAARREHLCTSRRLQRVVRAECTRRWPQVRAGKWAALMDALTADSIDGSGAMEGFVWACGASFLGSNRVGEWASLCDAVHRFLDDVALVERVGGILPFLPPMLNRTAPSGSAAADDDDSGNASGTCVGATQ